MGWWWSNGSSKEAPIAEPVATKNAVAPENKQADHPVEPQSAKKAAAAAESLRSAKRTLTRDEQTNEELITWLKDLQSQNEEKKASHAAASTLSSDGSPATAPAADDISPDSLYPREISARSAFDYAFFCQSFGGQFVNIYRYGSFRSCSNHWQDFWLAMRTRNWEAKERQAAIQDHYRKKAIKYKTGPSSEDVWDVRTEPVRDAFQGDLEELERAIKAWKEANPHAENN